jgi:hypothetical protein
MEMRKIFTAILVLVMFTSMSYSGSLREDRVSFFEDEVYKINDTQEYGFNLYAPERDSKLKGMIIKGAKICGILAVSAVVGCIGIGQWINFYKARKFKQACDKDFGYLRKYRGHRIEMSYAGAEVYGEPSSYKNGVDQYWLFMNFRDILNRFQSRGFSFRQINDWYNGLSNS